MRNKCFGVCAMNRLSVDKYVGTVLLVICRWVILLSVGYVILFPLFSMISQSLMSQSQFMDSSVVWIPKELSFENFRIAYQALRFPKTALQTLLINIGSGLLEVLTCAITAYGFARFRFRGKKLCMALLLMTIIVSPQMLIIPTYMNFRQFDVLGIFGLLSNLLGTELRLNLIDTPFTFYLPSLLSVGYRSGLMIFIYMQFFKGLPGEIEEAGRIDGASALRIFTSIVLPSSGVALLCVSIFSMIWHWNEYYLSVMYFTSDIPLSVQLAQLQTALQADGISSSVAVLSGIVKSACLLFILPPLALYLLLQRKFIQSIDRVGIVG